MKDLDTVLEAQNKNAVDRIRQLLPERMVSKIDKHRLNDAIAIAYAVGMTEGIEKGFQLGVSDVKKEDAA